MTGIYRVHTQTDDRLKTLSTSIRFLFYVTNWGAVETQVAILSYEGIVNRPRHCQWLT